MECQMKIIQREMRNPLLLIFKMNQITEPEHNDYVFDATINKI